MRTPKQIANSNSTERGSAGSTSIGERFPRSHPALPRSVLLLFAICITALAQTAPGFDELKKGDYENAFKLLIARLAQTPTDAVAQRALLRVYIETGRYTEAEATAKKFLLKTPDNGPVRHELA